MTTQSWTGCERLKPANNWTSARSGEIDPGFLASRIWPGADYGRALAYLWRRFGQPGPFDHDKYLCEYDLTTPDPEVGFWLSCDPHRGSPEPGYWLSGRLAGEIMERYLRSHRDWPPVDPANPIYGGRMPPEGTAPRRALDAIAAGMRDLLRPVFVRDVPINVLGPLDDDHDWDLYPESKHAWSDR